MGRLGAHDSLGVLMKVLITGGRKGSDTDPSAIYGLDTPSEAVIEALKKGGHEIDHFPIEVGEDVSKYDLVIVMPCNPTVWGSIYFLGMLWTMAQRRHGGPPVVALFKHWDIRAIWAGIKSLDSRPDKLYDGFIEYRWSDVARKDYDELIRGELHDLAQDRWPPTMTSAWEWGDHSLLTKGTGIPHIDFCFDPSNAMYYPTYEKTPFEDRRQSWVLGTYEDARKWIAKQKLAWPVESYGFDQDDTERGLGRKRKKKRIPRDELVKKYYEAWGGLSPVYYHAGSGYWRARFVHYAAAGMIALADPAEVRKLGTPYLFDGPTIERLSNRDRQRLASEQADLFWSKCWDEDRCTEEILAFLTAQSQMIRHGEPVKARPPQPKEVTLF
jgi:hypothetical protein